MDDPNFEVSENHGKAPPPVPPPELTDEQLRTLIDEGRVQEVENALREQSLRLPRVLEQLNRVLEQGLGNLATALATMLISRFHVSRAGELSDRVLDHADSAGADELLDLVAALIQQERLQSADKVLAAARQKDPTHARGLYFKARLLARQGKTEAAFEHIARVSTKVLGAVGLATQARYATLCGRPKAAKGALKGAKKAKDPEATDLIRQVEDIQSRLSITGLDITQAQDLQTIMAIEYGSMVVELSKVDRNCGRFVDEALSLQKIAPLIRGIVEVIQQLGLPMNKLFHATEDGEIVAAAIHHLTDVPYQSWRQESIAEDGSWLCMGAASTHPHLRNPAVQTLHAALNSGSLRSLALVLPTGTRGPLVPDIIGQMGDSDEMPWAIDDEVEDVLEEVWAGDQTPALLDHSDPNHGPKTKNHESSFSHVERFGGILRATQKSPRPGHVPFLDEARWWAKK